MPAVVQTKGRKTFDATISTFCAKCLRSDARFKHTRVDRKLSTRDRIVIHTSFSADGKTDWFDYTLNVTPSPENGLSIDAGVTNDFVAYVFSKAFRVFISQEEEPGAPASRW
jgi:hypothetical protein